MLLQIQQQQQQREQQLLQMKQKEKLAKEMAEREEEEVRDDATFLLDLTGEEIFSQYTCKSHKFGNPHPGDITEASILGSVSLPPPAYPIERSLPAELIANTKLSCLQLEGVLFACQRHLRVFANGERAGFFLGDGAGVGKGRQIAAIILDNIARGRKQHVWISIASDLYHDAVRFLCHITFFYQRLTTSCLFFR
jgi:hypothetical protein